MSSVGVPSAIAALNAAVQAYGNIDLVIGLSDQGGEFVAEFQTKPAALAGLNFYAENLVQTQEDRDAVATWLSDLDDVERPRVDFQIGNDRAILTR